ncbi:hypothetical protein ID866_6730 [Astraeus odoratus]|nr:hypothetical protein ID866_6730 [Astraeus odoratus]
MVNPPTERVAGLCRCAADRCLQYRSGGKIGDLDGAISLNEQGLELYPVGHADRPPSLANLANCIYARYQPQAALGDLEEAISLHQQALEFYPVGHQNRSSSLASLANCMHSRYKSQGALGDLEEAISILHEVLELCPVGHPNRSPILGNLAICMHSRYQSQGAVGDLEQAISFHEQVLKLHPVDHPNRSSSLCGLAMCMKSRYKSQGGLEDLEEAISLLQQALELCPVDHPNRLFNLGNLAICMHSRYQSQGALGDLEQAISLHQQALELHPVGHPNRSSSLHGLAICMKSRYQSQGALGDLEEAIFLHQQALELYPISHLNRQLSLGDLANCMCSRYDSQGAQGDLEEAISLRGLAICMKSRYDSQGALRDLEEAISLHQQALEFYPISHPNRPTALGDLANCMHSRYDSHGAPGDLEEAISLLHKVLELCPVGHPNRSPNLDNLAICMHSRYQSQGAFGDLEQAISLHQQALQLINNAIQDILHSIPPRLVQTDTGILLSHEDMRALFYQQPQYQALVTSLEEGGDWHSSLNHMQASIADYFKYAILSHRWGSNEPLLQDILGHGSIYDMSFTDGLAKLIMFCCTASHHGYSWTWSDTCCIDKTNSVELQEAIGSMFSWYQQSALTIVYLADISACSSLQALSSSVWFRRGWTLQELLASQKILFYAQDWSPCMNSTAQNHKQDVHFLNALNQATGIPCQYLSKFHPNMDNARLKLQWATTRQTTRPEDIAYSLFGMFNLHLPVLYGEGKEKSLIRLLHEVLSHTCDISILHWAGEQSSFHSCFPANISPYQPLPHIKPDLTSLAIQRSLSRLQRLVSTDNARKVYSNLTKLHRARFINYTLTLPCIVHHIRTVDLRKVHKNNRTYEVQAVGLRPVEITTQVELKEALEPTKLPYVLIRPWDRKMIDYSEEDHSMAGYKALMELEQPFIALMLV